MHEQENFLSGLMMETPLTITSILHRAAQFFPEKEIVSRYSDGSIHRTNYGELYKRVIRLMNALREMGIGPGDRVASFAWNSHRHLELYFAVPCLGAVLHTANIRLFPDQIAFILNHAGNKAIFADASLAPALVAIQSELKTVETFVLMDDRGTPPASTPTPFLDYEEILENASTTPNFPELDERMAAGLCYTSGTTGDPKGSLYSHRSLYLHAMGCCMADSFGISEREVVLPVVPMFHANCWGLPYCCAMTGAKIVFPGNQLLGRPLAELMEREGVTFSAGVPTVWNLLYQHLRQSSHDLSRLKVIISGGSATPRTLIDNYQREYGISLLCVWGMTEMSPIGSVCRLKSAMESWSSEDQLTVKAKPGFPVAGVEMRILGENGEELPWDGVSAGELVVRGPWVIRSYFAQSGPGASFTEDGWLRTGDIASLDSWGYLEITDRKKDVIKSRGEWISSVDMENAIMGHPDVFEAAVVGKEDAVRGEVPIVFVVIRDPNKPLTPLDIHTLLQSHFAKWQLPRLSEIHFVESLPKTSVGKMDKKALRQRLTNSS